MLEAMQYPHNSFVTLTYDDEHLPEGNTLVPKHFQDWLKRFRKSLAPHPIRYYGVGEYGDQSERPHFHVAVFNYETCRFGRTDKRYPARDCCESCMRVHNSWGNGRILQGTLEFSSAQYIAGYVTKKMTAKDDPRLNGRHPEFARMSLRPGIGADALHEVASSLMEFSLEVSQADVPSGLRHGGRIFPLGRYMRRRLRKLVGLDEAAPQATLDQIAEELSELYETAGGNTPYAPAKATIFKNLIIDAGDQAVKNMEARSKIWKQKREI